MRLQVEIRRNSLPSVNIIYNTSSAHLPVRTVSDFLTALDRIVPLESADGEWGLEDYIVEVAATADQTSLYECLHYQSVKDVFREDDEVVVRNLTTEDLRERRRGGRLQISSDGRHLFDGVAWGRTYNAQVLRPGIAIPPRKKRKLMLDDDKVDPQEGILQLEHPSTDTQIGSFIDDEDDEDDEDFEDGDGNVSEETTDNSEDADGQDLRQIVTREEFDDADVDNESDMERPSEEEAEAEAEPAADLEEDELQLLLTEAEEVEKALQKLPLELRITSPPKKRKRAASHQDAPTQRRVSFEGVPSPTRNLSNGSSSQERLQGRIGGHAVVAPEADPVEETTNLDCNSVFNPGPPAEVHNKKRSDEILENGSQDSDLDSESDSDSDSDLDDSFEISKAKEKRDDDSDSGSESSDSGSGSESDSDLTSSSGSEDSDTDADSDSDSTSSSGESDSEPEPVTSAGGVSKKPINDSSSASGLTADKSIAKTAANKPPGSGKVRTMANNNRVKRRKHLNRLKKEGVLPIEANFSDLKAYETKMDLSEDQSITNEAEDSTSLDLAHRKEEILARLSAVYEDPSATEGAVVGDQNLIAEKTTLQPPAEGPVSNPLTSDNAQVIDATPEEPKTTGTASKRARLDIASSRRMLFNSLGLRNPKTPAAEQALREQLSKPVRNIQPQTFRDVPIDTLAAVDDDLWKKKLIISAVECLQEGVTLTPPPFPFKQRWENTTTKKKARLLSQYYEQQSDSREVVETRDAGDVLPQTNVSKVLTDSRTVSAGTAELNDILHPSEIATLPWLTPSDLHKDAIVAYKELQINARYEPEESDYRIARVTNVEHGSITLLLSKRYREQRQAPSFDSETGKRLYDKFEVPNADDDLIDDGIREVTFDSMINPRLVQTGKVQVPASQHGDNSGDPGTQVDNDSDRVPESGPQHELDSPTDEGRVNTQTRQEITKIIQDAGFNPTIDEQLLQPIDIPKTHLAAQLSAPGSRADSQQSEIINTKPPKTMPRGLPEEWRSSPFEPDAENSTSQPKVQDDTSSQPSISMVETVDYPHVSNLDMSRSAFQDHAGSSSHQDAQRVSPDVSDIEHSDLKHLRLKRLAKSEQIDSQTSSLPSEVPQSQPNFESSSHEQVLDRNEHATTSMSLRGGDGASEFHVPYDSELDSDGLPSLRALTSSGQERSSRGNDPRLVSTQSYVQSRVSPPPLRKSRSHGNIGRRSRSPMSDKNSQPGIKISASQQQVMNMTQIPQDTTTGVVDLTMSSDPVESNGNENENENEEGSEYEESPRAKRAAARSNKSGSSSRDGERQGRTKTTKSAYATVGLRKSLSGKTRSRV